MECQNKKRRVVNMIEERTSKAFNEARALLEENGFIENSSTEDNSEIVLQKESVQIDLTNLLTFHHRKENLITREQFLKNTNEEELFAVFESVYQRCIKAIKNQEGFNVEDTNSRQTLTFYLTDKEKNKAIKQTLKEWSK